MVVQKCYRTTDELLNRLIFSKFTSRDCLGPSKSPRKGIAEHKVVHAESLGEKQRDMKKMQTDNEGRGYISTCGKID